MAGRKSDFTLPTNTLDELFSTQEERDDADTDYTEWYVDQYGDLRADATHHDGTNHYLYRVFKDGVSETQMENLRDKIYHGKATRADITRLTRRLGDEIAAVYGFDIPKQRVSQERSER